MPSFSRLLAFASLALVAVLPCTAQTVDDLDRAVRATLYNNPDSARILIAKQEALGKQLPMPDAVHYTVARNWGGYYWIVGKLDTSLAYFSEAMEIAVQLNDTDMLASANNNLGIIYIDLEDWERALSYEQAALNLTRNGTDYLSITACYLNLAIVQKNLGQDTAALHLLDSAQTIAELYDLKQLEALVYNSYADIYLNLNHPYLAKAEALRCIPLAKSVGDNKTIVHASLHLSRACIELQNPDSAKLLAEQALTLARDLKFREGVYEAYYHLYLVAQAQGDAVTSIAHFEQYIQARDSMYSGEILTEIRNLELEALERSKDTEHATSTATLRNRIIGLSALLLGLLGAVLVFRFRLRKAQERAEALQAERQLAESKAQSAREVNVALEQQLEQNKKELLQYALTVERQSELLNMVEAELKKAPAEADSQVLKDLNSLLKRERVMEADWLEFEARFNQVNDAFYQRLTALAPKLSAADLRLSAFLKMHLSSKQIAYLLRIEPSSVDVARYRLRKKLGLDKEQKLAAFLNGV